MRKVRDIAEAAFDYIDIDEDNDGELIDDASPRQQKVVCSCITGALQELQARKPDAFVSRVGKTVAAPVSGTAVLTAGSTAVNLSSWGGADLRGKMIRVGSTWNQVAAGAAAPGNALVLPWRGASGTASIVVYDDAVLVGAEGFVVVGNVWLEGYGMLRACPDRATYTAFRDDLLATDYSVSRVQRQRSVGQPESWWVESAWAHAADTGQQLYMRLAPLPEQEYSISYDLALRPRELVPDDLEDEDLVIPVVEGFYDSVLIPWVLQRWTASPWFKNESAKAEIARQFSVAQNILHDLSGQQETNSRLVVAMY